jgi:hypothetical protein
MSMCVSFTLRDPEFREKAVLLDQKSKVVSNNSNFMNTVNVNAIRRRS